MSLEELWQQFPRTLAEFDERFPDEEACRRYLIDVRWGGRVRCARCQAEETWELGNGRFECKRCGHQTSVTAGTLLHGTRKPLKLWFRAMWEMASRKNGVNACELQRLMGFGSYGTAWNWLHKLRRAMARRSAEPLWGEVVVDDAYLGAKRHATHLFGRGTTNDVILVAAENGGGRIRIARAEGVTEAAIGPFIEVSIAPDARVVTDGWAGYSVSALNGRAHVATSKIRHAQNDPLQMCHIVIALLKRWWLGTFHGAISSKHLDAYLEEFAFRFNRRKTTGAGRITARLLHLALASQPITEHDLFAQPFAA